MQDRILQRMAQQNLTPAPQAAAGLRWPWLAGGLAMAAVVLVAILSQRHVVSVSVAPRPTMAQTAVPQPIRTVQPAPTPAPKPTAARNIAPQRAASPVPHTQELASFPAPEAPLTEQEKLLLNIAQHPGPDELALLNPEKRDEIAQMSATDFNLFFPQPLPQEKFYELQHQDR
jgi:hypothetical protein